MTELAYTIQIVEGVANTTSVLINKLEKTVKKRTLRGRLKPR